VTEELALAGQAQLWQLYDAITADTLSASRRGVRPFVTRYGTGHDASVAPKPAWWSLPVWATRPTLIAPDQVQDAVAPSCWGNVSPPCEPSHEKFVRQGPSPRPAGKCIAATADSLPEQAGAWQRARAFAEPLCRRRRITGHRRKTCWQHADAVAAILRTIGGSEAMQAASYLVYACDHLNKPHEIIAKAFGDKLRRPGPGNHQAGALAAHGTACPAVGQPPAAAPHPWRKPPPAQTGERSQDAVGLFSNDLRVVMLRLASRLQTLRHFAATKLPVPPGLASGGPAGVCAAGQPRWASGNQVGDGRPVLPLS